MSEETQEDWPYWKAAISCLPSQQMRDAAWEFFVRHLAQNPIIADTFSGVILVMQANGLFMLKVPKLVHDLAETTGRPNADAIASAIAGPVNDAVDGFVHKTVLRFVQSPEFEKLWVSANTRAPRAPDVQ